MRRNKSTVFHTALIGAGYWGSIIAKKLSCLTNKDIVIFDKKQKNCLTLKKKINNLTISYNLNSIFLNKNIKNIIFATPPEFNYKLILKALNYKKNIFAEKPITKNIKQLKNLIKLSKKENKVLMGGYIYLFNPFIRKIKKILDQKKLGKLKFILMNRKNLGPIRNMVDAHLDLSSHDISILKYFFKNKKLKIKIINKNCILKKNISDISSIKLTINSLPCSLNSSWLHPEKERKIIIIGSKKMLVFDEMIDNKIKIYSKYASYPDINFNKNDIFSNKARIHLGKTTNIKVKENDSLTKEIKHFIYCCNNNKKPITSGEFCFDVLKNLV